MVSMLNGVVLTSLVGPMKDFCAKLSGDNSEEWGRAFKRFLRKENPWPKAVVAEPDQVAVWRRVQVGHYSPAIRGSAEWMLKDMEQAGFYVPFDLIQMMRRVEFWTEPKTLQLVAVTVEELGLPDRATYKDIKQAGCDRGWQLCSTEVSLALCLQNLDQPVGESLVIAMEPVKDYRGCLHLLNLRSSRLDLIEGYTMKRWRSDQRFVFVRLTQ